LSNIRETFGGRTGKERRGGGHAKWWQRIKRRSTIRTVVQWRIHTLPVTNSAMSVPTLDHGESISSERPIEVLIYRIPCQTYNHRCHPTSSSSTFSPMVCSPIPYATMGACPSMPFVVFAQSGGRYALNHRPCGVPYPFPRNRPSSKTS
jgi:hypothetical protein